MSEEKTNKIARRSGAVRQLEADSAPVYRRLEDDLRSRIRAGEWKEGGMILGRQRLSEEYDVHVRTVERAIKSLIEDGTLETQGTRGTFVARAEQGDGSSLIRTSATPSSTIADRSSGFSWSEKLSRSCSVGIFTTDKRASRDTEAIIRSIEKGLSNAGASVVYINRTPPGKGERTVETTIADLLAEGCEAIVSLTYNDRSLHIDEFESMVGESAAPIIHVSSVCANRPVWNVYYDSVDAGFQATSHLISKGCRSFFYLAHERFQWADERLIGLQSALRRSRIDESSLRARFEDRCDENDLDHTKAARRAALETFADYVPDGVVAANDFMAHGVIQAAREIGLKPGEDFLLIGFDDSIAAQNLGLSSMRPPLEEMGAAAARLAVCALEGNPTYQKVCFSSHLIARNTTHRSCR